MPSRAEGGGQRPVEPLQIAGVGHHDHHAPAAAHGGRGGLGDPGRPVLPRQRRPHRPDRPPVLERPQRGTARGVGRPAIGARATAAAGDLRHRQTRPAAGTAWAAVRHAPPPVAGWRPVDDRLRCRARSTRRGPDSRPGPGCQAGPSTRPSGPGTVRARSPARGRLATPRGRGGAAPPAGARPTGFRRSGRRPPAPGGPPPGRAPARRTRPCRDRPASRRAATTRRAPAGSRRPAARRSAPSPARRAGRPRRRRPRPGSRTAGRGARAARRRRRARSAAAPPAPDLPAHPWSRAHSAGAPRHFRRSRQPAPESAARQAHARSGPPSATAEVGRATTRPRKTSGRG